jgi:hypothetical protein
MAPGVREIPFDQWESFFERLAEERRGWLATIELLGPAGGRVQVEDAPFEGIVVDASGAAGGELSVLVDEGPDRAQEKKLPAPAHVRIEATANGADETISIESHSGSTLLVRLRPPLIPGASEASREVGKIP